MGKKSVELLYDEVSFIRSDDRALVLAYSSTTCSSMSEYICKCAPTSEPGGVSIHGLLVIPWTGKDSERGNTAKRSFFMQKDLCALADTEELGKGEGHTTRHPQQLSCSSMLRVYVHPPPSGHLKTSTSRLGEDSTAVTFSDPSECKCDFFADIKARR